MKVEALITLHAEGKIYLPQSIVKIADDDEAKSLIERGFAKVANDEGESKYSILQSPNIEDIIEVIGMLSPDKDFTKSGVPKVEAIEAILEQNISSEDRDRAWDIYRQEGEAENVTNEEL